MKHKKAILAVWNKAGMGKTTTLRELVGVIRNTYPGHRQLFPPPPQLIGNGDIRWIGEIDGLIVAIETRGDPATQLQMRLVDLVENWKADVIFCATRTSGETVDAVNYVSKTYGHEGIWTSTYQGEEFRHPILNATKAKHLRS